METKSENRTNKVNINLFLKEFSCSENKIKTNNGEVEIADNIVLLNKKLFLYQIKERNNKYVVDENSEVKWFKNKVIKKAKKQLKDSINYIKEGKLIKNNRNKYLNISTKEFNKIYNIIIFEESQLLGKNEKNLIGEKSSEIGFINLFTLNDYNFVASELKLPIQISKYLDYRESLFDKVKIKEEKEILKLFYEENAFGYDFGFSRNILNKFYDKIIKCDKNKDYHKILETLLDLDYSQSIDFENQIMKILINLQNGIKNSQIYNIKNTNHTNITITNLNNFGKIICFMEKYINKADKELTIVIYEEFADIVIDWILYEECWQKDEEYEKEIKKYNYLKANIKS